MAITEEGSLYSWGKNYLGQVMCPIVLLYCYNQSIDITLSNNIFIPNIQHTALSRDQLGHGDTEDYHRPCKVKIVSNQQCRLTFYLIVTCIRDKKEAQS